jgi:hypothetical protein
LEPTAQRDLRLTLAGLQAGCLGSLLMIGWWLLAELIQRRSPWTVPNLLATTFYGERAYRSAFMASTWSGLATPVVVYCLAGVGFALLGRERKAGWLLVMIGAVTGLLLDWFVFDFSMRRINPLVSIYSPDRILAVSHLIYGITLASYPGFARDLLPQPATTSQISSATPPTQEPPEIPVAHSADLSDQEIGGGVPQSADETPTGPRPL